jgi:hypothetical protein
VRMLCGGRGRRVDDWRSANNIVPFSDQTEYLGIRVADNVNTLYCNNDNREADSNMNCSHGSGGLDHITACEAKVWRPNSAFSRVRHFHCQPLHCGY